MPGLKVFLVGMPGSGKSTLGKQLSDLSGLPSFDLDELIEAQAGKEVQAIFKDHGEAYFRTLESRVLREVTESKKAFILSCGGGTPCFHENMSYINEHGTSVFLDVPLPELTRRLNNSEGAVRPLVAAHREGLEDYLQGLLQERLPFYRRSGLCWTPAETTEGLATALGLLHPDA